MFLGSCQYGNKQCNEVALVGRSNVGKSSLINHLARQKQLAYVSSQPGKTTTPNFYQMNEHLILVDLPGYGYAQRSHKEKTVWSEAIETYFNQTTKLKLILLLVDIRRDLSEEDLQMIEWAIHHHQQLLLVLTKADALTLPKRKNALAKFSQALPNIPLIDYSIKEMKSHKRLRTTLQKLLAGP